MTEPLNLIKRPEGYKLYGPELGYTRDDYGIIGPDGLGRHFIIAQYASSSQIRLLDEHGEDSPFQQTAMIGTQYRCAALDQYGRVWIGDIFNTDISALDAEGAWVVGATMSLTDGSDTYEPWGMVFDEDDGYLYVLGQGQTNEGLQLFRIDVTPGSEAIVAWGGVQSAAVSPPPQDVHDIVKDPNGNRWTTDGSRLNAIVRFDAGTMFPELVSLSSPANRGLHRVCYAFEHLWVGGNSRHGVGAGNCELLKVQLDGTVVSAQAVSTAQRLGGFAYDENYLYALLAAHFTVEVTSNQVIVVDPAGPTFIDTFFFGGSSDTVRDGKGVPPRNIHVITEGENLDYPHPAFFDAALWFRGDDPELRSYGSSVRLLPNRGPQEQYPALKASRGLPGLATLSGNQALDFAGNVEDMRVRRKPTYSVKSVGFNQGAGTEHVTFGDSYNYDYLTDTATYSIWFRSSEDRGFNTPGALFGKMDPSTTFRGYSLVLDYGGALFFELYSDNGGSDRLAVSTTRTGFNDGLWHHVALVLPATPSAGTVKIYVDGRDEPLTTLYDTLSGTTTNTAELWAGARPNGGGSPPERWFQGQLADFSIFDAALSAAAVEELFNNGAPGNLATHSAVVNLVGWWRFGTGDTYPKLLNYVSGTAVFPTIPDESASGNDGTMVNMLASNIQVPVPWGKFSQYSYAFDGTADYITMGNIVHFEYNLAFSVEFWFYSSAANGTIVSKHEGATTYRGWTVYLTSGKIGWILANDTTGGVRSEIQTDATFNDLQWHHVVCVYTAATPGAAADMDIFVDGVDVATTPVASTLGSNTIINTASFNLACFNDGSNLYGGYLTDVALYDKALSLVEAQWIYNNGEPRDLRLPGAPSQLAAWWRLGDGGETCQSTWTHKVAQWVWGFGTKESTTITDASHLNSPGTLYNMVAGDVTTDTPGGLSDYSCTFDGINKCMACADTSTLYTGYNLGNGEVCSVAGWVKTTASTGWLWGNGRPFAAGLPNFIGYGVYLDAGRPTFILTSNSGSTAKLIRRGDNTINDGGWHFVVVTKFKIAANNHRVNIYVDGVLQPTTLVANTVGNNSVSGGGWRCGGQYNTVDSLVYNPLAGQLDEMSVWSKELSQADVTALFNGGAPTDLRDHAPTYLYLRGWWRMGDPYYAPGTVVGGMEYWRKTGWAPGATVYTSRSCYFDSSNDYVLIGDVPEIDFEYNESFSVSAWILPWGINAFRGIASKCTSYTAPGWMIDYYGGSGGITYFPYGYLRVVFTANGGTGQGFFEVSPGSGNNPLPFGSWLHFVMTYDGSNDANGIKFYINGELLPTQVRYNTAFVASLRNSQNVQIGHAQGYWSGFEDEVSIWDKELTQADVTEIYNSGDPDDLSGHTSVANLVGWWRMGEGALDGTLDASMIAAAINPEAPDTEEDLSWLHELNEPFTAALALYPTQTTASQLIFSTLDSALATTALGVALIYDGTNETVRIVVANGGGVSYTIDKTLATGTVPLNQASLLIFSVHPDDGLVARVWVIDQPLEYKEETQGIIAAAATGSAGPFALVWDAEVTGVAPFEGQIGEGALWRRLLLDVEQFEIVRYLRRWLP